MTHFRAASVAAAIQPASLAPKEELMGVTNFMANLFSFLLLLLLLCFFLVTAFLFIYFFSLQNPRA